MRVACSAHMKSNLPRSFLVALLGGVLVLSIALVFTVSQHRNYQVDEIEHVHAAFNLSDGRIIYRDFWQGHNPLLYGMLQPWIDKADPAGTFQAARGMVFCVLLGIVGALAFVAFRLAGAPGAVLASGLLLTHTTFVERAIEIRPDPFLTLAVVFVMATEVTRLAPRTRFVVQGIALSLAFLTTQKAGLFTVAVGLRWLIAAWRARRPSLVLLPCAAFLVPMLCAGYWMWSVGALPNYAQYNGLAQIKHVARATNLEFGPGQYLQLEGGRNPFSFWASKLCIGYAALRVAMPTILSIWGRISARSLAVVNDHKLFQLLHSALSASPSDAGSSYEHTVPLLFSYALFQVITLWINPFPYPYLHVTVLPGVALIVAYAIVRAIRHWTSSKPWLGYAAAVIAIALSLVTSLPRLLDKTVDRNAVQMAFISQVHALTPEDSTVFDLSGLHFRRDAYPVYTMTKVMIERYQQGAFPRMIPFLRENRVATVVHNYRTQRLGKDEWRFINEHFIRYDRYLYVPGVALQGLRRGESRLFEVLTPRAFRFYGEGRLFIDGAEFRHGMLGAGTYTLSAMADAVRGSLIADVPPPVFDDKTPRGKVYVHVFD